MYLPLACTKIFHTKNLIHKKGRGLLRGTTLIDSIDTYELNPLHLLTVFPLNLYTKNLWSRLRVHRVKFRLASIENAFSHGIFSLE